MTITVGGAPSLSFSPVHGPEAHTSTLDVGVCWLLFEKTGWTFDVGHREHGFSPSRAEQQFADALAGMVAHAARRVEDYRQRFATVQGALAHYQSVELRSHWDYYDAGVIAALAGDVPLARKHLESLSAQPRQYQWQQGLYYRALDLSRLLDNRRLFLDSITGIVLRTRSQLLLEEREIEKFGLPDDVG
jgi:hypothetical protein